MDNHPIPGAKERKLPESLAAEQAVLGAIFLEPKAAFDEANSRLNGQEFYDAGHRKLFTVMKELSDENVPIDMVPIVAKLQEREWMADVGGVTYLSRLAGSVPTAANVGHYIKIVLEKFAHRQLILDLQEQLKAAWVSEAPGDVIENAQTKLDAIAELGTEKKGARSIRQILPRVFEEVEIRFEQRNMGSVSGVPSGFRDLDRLTDGFQKTDLILIAARPSVGKTAFALNIAANAAETTGETVAIFSLEMSEGQLVKRMVCAHGNMDAGRLRTGWLESDDWEKITMSIGSLSELPIVIDDTPARSVAEIRAECRKIKREQGLGLVVIDYLQLIAGRGKASDNRQEEISHISRTLKQMARELEVPVIALSQLSRAVEQRQDKRPMMSDLRDSGSLEQDADLVAFLYRDDYYNQDSEKKNIIEVILSKQRNGPIGTVELAFLKQFNKFVSLDRTGAGVPPERSGRAVPDMYRRS